jgi:UDP-N-acetylmuramoyl-tripeptide--D-alanyl-D-alanine ligase
MKWTYAEIAAAIGSPAPAAPGSVADWSIDTRTLGGDRPLYIALRGDVHDGHDFVAQAAERGAVAVMVDREVAAGGAVQFRVRDTLVGLQELARRARLRLPGTVIGVTGSAGKTTTKETIAALLMGSFRVGRNEGNLNNHIGLPLSILRQSVEEEVYVFEMGMNHLGEIRFLASIGRPHIAVVTNVGTAHIENLGSREAIGLAKRELVESLPPDGVAVVNADDRIVARFGEIHPGRTVTFGLSEGADVRVEELEMGESGARFRIGGVAFETPVAGKHSVMNVAAAVAVGSELGVPVAAMADRARGLQPGKMRGERQQHNGVTILNDCYNSNPDAALAMLEYAALLPAARRIAMLGEMRELGAWSVELHRTVGQRAAELGFDLVIGVTGDAAALADAARAEGAEAIFFPGPVEAGEALAGLARPGDLVLFKGSRGTRMELAVERYRAG